jgi:hypothetical protein
MHHAEQKQETFFPIDAPLRSMHHAQNRNRSFSRMPKRGPEQEHEHQEHNSNHQPVVAVVCCCRRLLTGWMSVWEARALHAGGTVLDNGAVLDLTNLVKLGASLQLCLVKYYARRALLAAGKRNTFNNIDPSVLQQLPEYLRELFPCHCAVDEEDGPQSQKGSILVMKGFAQWASSSLKEG